MTRLEFWSAVMGLLVTIVVMFNQMNRRVDRLQADTNARFDQMFDRMDRMQAENNRRFDALLETIMTFDGRCPVTKARSRSSGSSCRPRAHLDATMLLSARR